MLSAFYNTKHQGGMRSLQGVCSGGIGGGGGASMDVRELVESAFKELL